MATKRFLIKIITFGVHALYINPDYLPWEYSLNFETGIFKCDNRYGIYEYQLSSEDLAAFEKEIVDSHALEWTDEGLEQGFDGRTWSLECTLTDGRTIDLWGMHTYKYNYLKLEHVFASTEQHLRGGSMYGIDVLEEIPRGECVDLKEAMRKYPEEFK